MKSCLLIIPKHFYSFKEYISKTLEAKGYEVTLANDEYPESNVGRLVGKFFYRLLWSITEKQYDAEFINNKHYDLVLIFKGRGLSPSLIEKIKKVSDRVIAYNWDSFILNKAPLNWYKLITKYYTFDYRDAEQFHLPIVELFSSSNAISEKHISYQLCSIVRNHSSRLSYIDKVLKIMQPESFFLSVFEQNYMTMVFNFIRNPFLYLKYRQYISFKPLNYSKYTEVMSASEFTIDYAHETQTGITMRCFEAINTKTKIITNNPYIKRSTCFVETDYIIFEDMDKPEVLLQSYETLKNIPYASSPRRITHFIDDLLA